jgi:AcrR family transcriptional regulator
MTGRISTLYDTFLKKAPKQSRSRSVVEAILEAAAERLSRTGDESDITVNDVAARAGIGIGSLYDYFKDRRSLLAGVAAKITEDNLRDFEALLVRTRDLPLRESIELIVDHAFAIYAGDRRIPRAILRVAHSTGLMPALAESQSIFADALGKALSERKDVDIADPRRAAHVLTHALMGVVHSAIWSETMPVSIDELRAGVVNMVVDHLERIDEAH